MKLIRSFPADVPPGRSYVVDDAKKFFNADYDYRGLAAFRDDVVHIDWDTAVSREDLACFADLAREHPDRVLVAPVPVYPDSRAGLPGTVWNLRRYTDGESRLRYIEIGEPTCHLFGFGMVYLPAKLLDAFERDWPGRFDDTGFAGWHYRHVEREVPIAWQVRPVHLHYRISEVAL